MTLDNARRRLDAWAIGKYCPRVFWLRRKTRSVAVQGVSLSIQVAILKILASHRSGRAEVSSINRDIAVLTASGAEWSARIKRLAARVPGIDIFGDGYVRRGDEGWEITARGREFLARLEAITQDNVPSHDALEPAVSPSFEPPGRDDLIVVGHRWEPAAPARRVGGVEVRQRETRSS